MKKIYAIKFLVWKISKMLSLNTLKNKHPVPRPQDILFPDNRLFEFILSNLHKKVHIFCKRCSPAFPPLSKTDFGACKFF